MRRLKAWEEMPETVPDGFLRGNDLSPATTLGTVGVVIAGRATGMGNVDASGPMVLPCPGPPKVIGDPRAPGGLQGMTGEPGNHEFVAPPACDEILAVVAAMTVAAGNTRQNNRKTGAASRQGNGGERDAGTRPARSLVTVNHRDGGTRGKRIGSYDAGCGFYL
jgi:hypothetical protein